MKITLDGITLFINDQLAGSLEDAITNFPDLTKELYVVMHTQFTSLQSSYDHLTADYVNVVAERDTALAELALLKAVTEPNPRVIPVNMFRNKFTTTSLAQIWSASIIHAEMGVFLIQTFTTPTVDLDSENVQNGLLALTQLGIPYDPALF